MGLKDNTYSFSAAAKVLKVGPKLCRQMAEMGQLDVIQVGKWERLTKTSVERKQAEAAGR